MKRLNLLLSAGAALVLSGCVPWVAGQAALAVLPVVTSNAGPGTAKREHLPVAVPDSGRSWERTMLNSSGAPLDLANYRDGEPVRVQWAIPFQTQAQVEAVAAVVDASCATSTAAPSRWGLTRPTGVPSPGEVWYVARSSALTRPVSGLVGATGSIMGSFSADRLRSRLKLPGSVRLGWVVIVPQPGAYKMEATWDVAASGDLGASPCIRGWVAAPLAWVLEATRGIPESAGTSASGDSSVAADTSDMGLAAGQIRPPVIATSADAAPTDPAVNDTVLVSRRLNLLGSPAFDLTRLHQAGIDMDYAPPGMSDPSGLSEARLAQALRSLRSDRLTRLRSMGLAGKVAICTLVHQGVGARPLKVWGDAPTIPLSDQAPCLAAGQVRVP